MKYFRLLTGRIEADKKFSDHIKDLRNFFLISLLFYSIIFGLCFYFSKEIYFFLTNSLISVLSKYSLPNEFIITSVTEVFSTYLKLSFYISLILFFPVFLSITYIYMIPVFSEKEKKISQILLLMIPIFFFIGSSFAFTVAFNIIWDFFIKLSILNTDIILLPKVSEYINLVLSMTLAFGLAFELPVFLVILNLANLIDEKSIVKFGRYAIVISFVLGAILTPPDPISQVLVAIILICLYYLSYFIIKFISKIR